MHHTPANPSHTTSIDDSAPSGDGLTGDMTPPRLRTHRSRKSYTISRGGQEMIYYGRSAYMLNRCLDDIESFFKQLKRYLKHKPSKSEARQTESRMTTPPHQDEAIDAIRKIKFSFNIIDKVKDQVPEAAFKVFLRLVKFTQWLDDLCRHQAVEDYDTNLVSDVIEPLLTESTIMALDEQLPPSLFEFWQELGPAWNTPAENWPNILTNYMPQFSTTLDKEQTLQRWRSYQHDTKSRSGKHLHERPSLTMEVPHEVSKDTHPPLDHEQTQHFLKVQEQGSKLCYATLLHASKDPTQLHASQGDVFEVIENDNDTWWTVKNYSGMTGQLPKWKLQTFHLNKDHQTPLTPRYSRTGTLPSRFSRYREHTTGSDVRLNGVFHNAAGRGHYPEHLMQLDSWEEHGVPKSPTQHDLHAYHHLHAPMQQRSPSYMTLTDKQDTIRSSATLSRRYNSLYPIGSGTLRMFDHSPNRPCVCGSAFGNLECAHPHPHSCSCEKIPLGMVETLPRSGITSRMTGTIGRSNTYQSILPFTSRMHDRYSRSYSMDSVEKSTLLESSLGRFNSHTSAYYKPTMTLERKRHHEHKK